MTINIADAGIVLVIVLSALLAVRRGFTREALSLASWIAAFLIARLFGPALEILLEGWTQTPSARAALAFGLLFAATLIVGALINHLVGELVRATGLKGTDRLFGAAFGAVRGVLLVTVLVALGRHLFEADPWWRASRLVPVFAAMEDWTRDVASQLIDVIMTIGSD